jgi:hypothetical protein
MNIPRHSNGRAYDINDITCCWDAGASAFDELEHTITVSQTLQRPHGQRMSSASNDLLCNKLFPRFHAALKDCARDVLLQLLEPLVTFSDNHIPGATHQIRHTVNARAYTR